LTQQWSLPDKHWHIGKGTGLTVKPAFFYNTVMSVGIKGVIGIFSPATIKTEELIPAN